jgi:hypothetical protein
MKATARQSFAPGKNQRLFSYTSKTGDSMLHSYKVIFSTPLEVSQLIGGHEPQDVQATKTLKLLFEPKE